MDYPKLHGYLNARRRELDDDFQRQRPVFLDIQEFISPYTGMGLSGNYADEKREGHRKDLSVLDSTATFAMKVLAAGLMGGITSPSRPWKRLSLPDQDLAQYKPVKQWLYTVDKRMDYLFSRSNTYQGLHSFYYELGNYATAAKGVFESFETGIRVRPFTCGEYRFALSSDLVVDTFIHVQFLSARQIVQSFGLDNVSTAVKDAYTNKRPEQLFEVCWIVEPNDDRFEDKDFMDRPFRSVYWEPKSTEPKCLEVSGYYTFPVMVGRWDVVGGRAWGTGCGHDIIGHTKELQKLKERNLVIIDKQTEPPLVGPSSLKSGMQVNTMPGGITAIDEMSNTPGVRQLYQVQADMQALQLQIEDVRRQIRQGCYNDLFLMLASQPFAGQRTATEIAERHEEKLVMLGPVLERLHSELLNPLIDRTFDIMMRQVPSMIPPPPQEIQGMPITVEFTSILAQAQKMIGLQAINQYMGFAGSMIAAFPETRYKIAPFATMDAYSEMTGVPPDITVDDEIAYANMEADAKKQQAMETAANVPATAQAAKVLSETGLDRNSALDALLGRQQQ